jgi:hypothetical protein
MTAAMTQSRQRNLAMMSAPARWPLYPFLPLRRLRNGDTGADLGILYDAWGLHRTPGFSATVFLCNVVTVPPTEERLFAEPREVFDTFDELFDAGWRVD